MFQQCFVKKTILSFNSSLNSSKSFIVIAPSLKSEIIFAKTDRKFIQAGKRSKIQQYAEKNG